MGKDKMIGGHTMEEIEKAREYGEKVADRTRKFLEGKQTIEVIPLDIAAVVFGCLRVATDEHPYFNLFQEELYDLLGHVAYAILELQKERAKNEG